MFADSPATITCWAMGITQHHNSVATIKEIVNVALLQGNIGKPGAGLCPVRGHSNVQGDRTMGIWERVPDHFLDAIRDEFGFDPPREHGHDTVGSIRALRDGKVRVFIGMGGNFVARRPRHRGHRGGDAQRRAHRARLHQAQPLARRPRRRGADPARALGRSEKDLTGGRVQRVTVEDSMSAVHASHGPLDPPSEHLRSEVDIVCSLALATLGEDSPVPWAAFRDDYTEIRRRIARVVPGCASYDEKVDQPGGFVLPHPPRDNRVFETAERQGRHHLHAARGARRARGAGFLLQTLRSHDQFNTTIYGLDDRYRGIKGGRRVVFVNPDDIRDLGYADGDVIDLVSEWHDGVERVGAVLPDRVLRPAARVRGRLLPRDQPARPARLHRGEEQPPRSPSPSSSGWTVPARRTGEGSVHGSSDQGSGSLRARRAAPPELSGLTVIVRRPNLTIAPRAIAPSG